MQYPQTMEKREEEGREIYNENKLFYLAEFPITSKIVIFYENTLMGK